MIELIKNNPMIVAGVLVGAGLLAWLALRGAKGMGQDIGSGAINLGVGVLSGAGHAVVDNALDPSVNPLYDFGTWIGGKAYDITHPSQP